MQVKRGRRCSQPRLVPGATDLLLTGRFQVRVLARELSNHTSGQRRHMPDGGAGVASAARVLWGFCGDLSQCHACVAERGILRRGSGAAEAGCWQSEVPGQWPLKSLAQPLAWIGPGLIWAPGPRGRE